MAFNPIDGRIYFQGGENDTSLLAINASLQIETVGGNLSTTDSAMALLPIGTSGSLLLEQLMSSTCSYCTAMLLYDIQSGNVTNITSSVGNSNQYVITATLLPSLDGKSVYTQNIYHVTPLTDLNPEIDYGGSIIKYVLTATSPFLQQTATLQLPFVDPRLAAQDDRFLYVWGRTPPAPSVVVKVDPNTLTVDPSPALNPGAPDFLYDSPTIAAVLTGHYTLDLPGCRTWFCDATPWPARP